MLGPFLFPSWWGGGGLGVEVEAWGPALGEEGVLGARTPRKDLQGKVTLP